RGRERRETLRATLFARGRARLSRGAHLWRDGRRRIRRMLLSGRDSDVCNGRRLCMKHWGFAALLVVACGSRSNLSAQEEGSIPVPECLSDAECGSACVAAQCLEGQCVEVERVVC